MFAVLELTNGFVVQGIEIFRICAITKESNIEVIKDML